MPTEFHGVQIYEKFPNGCLNGVYTNNETAEIFNEIARKRGQDLETIAGIYDCFYYNPENARVSGTLKIMEAGHNRFRFIWIDDSGNQEYEGDGWVTQLNQITVMYWKINSRVSELFS